MKKTQAKKKKYTEQDFRLLVSFLQDENEQTVQLVKDQVRMYLKRHPEFRTVVSTLENPALQFQLEMLLGEFWYRDVLPSFKKFLRQGPKLDLERAVFYLAVIEHPEIKIFDISKELDQIAEKVKIKLAEEFPLPTKPVHVMGKILFKELGFKGNLDQTTDLNLIFMNKVLEKRQGTPMALSLVYLFVAWRLNLLVHGVGLPGHFIVGHRVPRGVIHIDTANGGKILRKKDCEVIVKKRGFFFKEDYLDPLSNKQILTRLMINLVNIYTEQGATAKAHWIAKLFHLFQESH